MKKHFALMVTVALLALVSSCTGGNKFKVSGTIAGATDSTVIILEESSNGQWWPLDTTHANGSGAYSFASQAPQFPTIYRLRVGEQSVNFPIDSVESITLDSDLKAFDTQFTLDGSDHAKQVMQIDKDALKYLNANPEQLKQWKNTLAKQILVDPSGIVAYYVINKYVNDAPLFNPLNDDDMKIIGAVANAFDTFKKGDPRTAYLVQMTLDGQRRRREARGTGAVLEAQEVSLLEINLQDNNGKQQSLQATAGKGKVVLLNFTMYDQQFSPAYNKLLNDVVTAYPGKVSVYQVGLDQNVAGWKATAQNLPWITVYDPDGENSTNVANYNIASIPVTYIIDKQGMIAERVDDPYKLKAAVAKYL